MCLFASQKAAEEIKTLLEKDGLIVGWKAYNIKTVNPLVISSIYFSDKVGGVIDKPGDVVSNRNGTDLIDSEVPVGGVNGVNSEFFAMVLKGIHVSIPLKECSLLIYNKTCVIPVICKKEDFVAAGLGEAVFTKVTITQETWDELVASIHL